MILEVFSNLNSVFLRKVIRTLSKVSSKSAAAGEKMKWNKAETPGAPIKSHVVTSCEPAVMTQVQLF